MHALIGQVRLKPGREQEALALVAERDVAMLQGMSGSAGGYWARARRWRRGPAFLLAV